MICLIVVNFPLKNSFKYSKCSDILDLNKNNKFIDKYYVYETSFENINLELDDSTIYCVIDAFTITDCTINRVHELDFDDNKFYQISIWDDKYDSCKLSTDSVKIFKKNYIKRSTCNPCFDIRFFSKYHSIKSCSFSEKYSLFDSPSSEIGRAHV